MREAGYYKSSGGMQCFIPYPLPPENPPFILDASLADLYGETMYHLGRLNEIAQHVPNIKQFIKAYIIKEALLSSAIEGVNTTMVDVFTQPLLDSKPNKNTQLVINYMEAVSKVLKMIQQEGLPLSSRVILKAHEILLGGGEGDRANPGNYRKQMVRVGNLIPAPFQDIPHLMSELEKFINTYETIPTLVKTGLMHVQFETIHPFLDGNGRIGRMLIVLMLIEKGVLQEPIIYPSYYFKKYHLEYYHRLDRVRTHGDFEGWIQFYLKVIKDSSIDVYRRTQDIKHMGLQFVEDLWNNGLLTSKNKEEIYHVMSILFKNPIISITTMSEQLNVSYNTANRVISELVQAQILVEETQQKRGKLFKFKKYLEILEKEYPE
jgi:Fic family protein